MRINPGRDVTLYQFDPSLTNHQLRLKIEIEEGVESFTDMITPLFPKTVIPVTENTQLIGEYPSNYLSVDYFKYEVLSTENYSIEFRTREQEEAGSNMIQVYA